jgi:hypothetical protein
MDVTGNALGEGAVAVEGDQGRAHRGGPIGRLGGDVLFLGRISGEIVELAGTAIHVEDVGEAVSSP